MKENIFFIELILLQLIFIYMNFALLHLAKYLQDIQIRNFLIYVKFHFIYREKVA